MSSNLLLDLGLAALTGSAVGAIISKFRSLDELRLAQPRLYEMLIGAGIVTAESVLSPTQDDNSGFLAGGGLRLPGYTV